MVVRRLEGKAWRRKIFLRRSRITVVMCRSNFVGRIEMQGMEWLGEEEGWVGEDGYDYSQHMMDPGSGVFINAFLDKAIDVPKWCCTVY